MKLKVPFKNSKILNFSLKKLLRNKENENNKMLTLWIDNNNELPSYSSYP